jgi:hypothetical protein
MKALHWFIAVALVFAPAFGHANKSSYSAGHFMLSLDGEPAVVKSVSPPKKQAATTSMDIEIEPADGDAMWAWVKSSFDQGPVPKKLVVPVDAKRRIEFTDVLIKEISFPALDASSKEAGSVKIRVVAKNAGTAANQDIKGNVGKKAKNWLVSNFEASIPKIPPKSVKKVDALTWSMKAQESAKKAQLSAKLSFDASSAPAWQAWAKSKAARTVSVALTDDSGAAQRTLILDAATVSSLKIAGATGIAVIQVGKISLK